jgi:peptidoglycan/LPS O-acetylase OafA/YrhL
MGFYRYFLALGVLVSHVGGGNWVIARTAVFCFYFVSGFLICRVLDTSYRGGVVRLAAFYCNRALRLLPLYLFIVLVTVAVFTIRGSSSFVRGDGSMVSPLYIEGYSLRFTDLLPLPVFDHSAPIPMLAGAGLAVMPQGWSIGVEVAFYVIAPVLVLLSRRTIWPLVVLSLAATAIFLFASFATNEPNYLDNFIYRNAYTSAFMFFWGAVIYVLARDTGFRIPFALGAPIVAAGFYYYYALATTGPPFATSDVSHDAFIFNILLGIPLSAVVCLTAVPAWLRPWESRIGDLSYGIYLNHLMVAGLLLWLAQAVGSEVFGHYGAISFGVWAIVASSLFAALTFNVIERPVEMLRRRLKTRPDRETVPSVTTAPSVATPAG